MLPTYGKRRDFTLFLLYRPSWVKRDHTVRVNKTGFPEVGVTKEGLHYPLLRNLYKR